MSVETASSPPELPSFSHSNIWQKPQARLNLRSQPLSPRHTVSLRLFLSVGHHPMSSSSHVLSVSVALQAILLVAAGPVLTILSAVLTVLSRVLTILSHC